MVDGTNYGSRRTQSSANDHPAFYRYSTKFHFVYSHRYRSRYRVQAPLRYPGFDEQSLKGCLLVHVRLHPICVHNAGLRSSLRFFCDGFVLGFAIPFLTKSFTPGGCGVPPVEDGPTEVLRALPSALIFSDMLIVIISDDGVPSRELSGNSLGVAA